MHSSDIADSDSSAGKEDRRTSTPYRSEIASGSVRLQRFDATRFQISGCLDNNMACLLITKLTSIVYHLVKPFTTFLSHHSARSPFITLPALTAYSA